MKTLLRLALCACLFLPLPTMGQDFLAPFEDFVEQLAAPPASRPPKPAPAESEPIAPVEVAPIPRPRPPDRPTPPVVTPPASAMENVETEEIEEIEEERSAAPSPPPAAQAATPETPDRIYQTACPALLSGKVVGEMLPPIAEGICGERSPLLVTAVNASGRTIPLSSPVTTNCEMAGALAEWVGDVDAYAKAALDSPIATLNTGTSYMCRSRVGGDEGFTSEHGFANAVDLVGFALENGETISVKDNWLPATAPEGKLLRQSHGTACGMFTTVLGPEANADHEDHLHLDLGCHGQTCTAQICE